MLINELRERAAHPPSFAKVHTFLGKKSEFYAALMNPEQIFRKDVFYVQIYSHVYRDFMNEDIKSE